MKRFNDTIDTINMIDEGILISKSQVVSEYEVSLKEVKDAVKLGDLEPMRFAGRDYFIARQVEMWKDANGGEEGAEE